MFREMRRKNREIDIDSAKQLLQSSRRGVLAVNGDDGYPYAIPINYLYDDEAQRIYFHGAKIGHKVDALRASDKVCFTVYGNETIRTDAWAPFMQSVVVFGGHPTWLKAIKPMLPDVKFIEGVPSSEQIKGAEMVWLQTNYMSHKAFYKIIDIVRSKNIPLRYFTSASAAKGAEQVVAADSGK